MRSSTRRARSVLATSIPAVVLLAAAAPAPPAPGDPGALPLATFEDSTAGRPPEGWKARGGKAEDVYVVVDRGDQKYLHAAARGTSIQIGRERPFDIREYPILSWRWRVHALPAGASERRKETGDSAAGVYVVFGGWPVPRTVKYVWSSSLPPGTRLASPFAEQTKIVVLRSGTAQAGEWVEERVNVLEDYRGFFGKDPDRAKGIGILTDSDNTRSRAVADYDAIVARRARAATGPRAAE